MKTIDHSIIKFLREAIDNSLKKVSEDFGVSIKTGNATFSLTNATFKLEIATIGKSGNPETKERTCFKTLAPMMGLKPEWLDMIIGLMPKSYKFPVLCEETGTGKRLKFPIGTIKNVLERIPA